MADTNNTEYETTFHKGCDYLPSGFDGEFTAEEIYKRDLLENLWCAVEGLVYVLAADDLPEGSRDLFIRAFQHLGSARRMILENITYGSRLIYFAEYNRPLWQKP